MLSSSRWGGNGTPQTIPTLLVFDESNEGRGPLASLLESRGYRVVETGSCPDAVDFVRHTNPSLVVVARDSAGPDGSDCRVANLRTAARKSGIPLLEMVDAEADLDEWIEQAGENEDWVARGSTPQEVEARTPA